MDRPKIIKDKACLEYIEYLEAQLKTPYAEAFISLKKMVDKGNEQLKEVSFSVFTDDGEKTFRQAGKFTAQLKDWYTEMEYFKSKMSPQEVADAQKGVVKSEGVEEFLKEQSKK